MLALFMAFGLLGRIAELFEARRCQLCGSAFKASGPGKRALGPYFLHTDIYPDPLTGKRASDVTTRRTIALCEACWGLHANNPR